MKENLFADGRIVWIKSMVESVFSLEFEENKQAPPLVLSRYGGKKVDLPHAKDLFFECLQRNGDANYQKLLAYMQDRQTTSALVFWIEKMHRKIEVLVDSEIIECSAEEKIESAKPSVVKRTDSFRNPALAASAYDSQASMLSDSAQIPLRESSFILEPCLPPKQITVQVGYEIFELKMAVETMADNLTEFSSVYFLKKSTGSIPEFSTSGAANEAMPMHLEVGYISNQALASLEKALQNIYLPLLTGADFAQFKDLMKETAIGPKYEELKNELLLSLQRFSFNVSHTGQQVAGETKLQIPEELSELNVLVPQQVATDRQMVIKLEELADEWIKTVGGALSKEQTKVPIGYGPLAEIEFWKDRSSSLSTLYEQLNLPIVHKIVQILNLSQAQSSLALEFQLSELNKFYIEAKDNVKFLSTLDRHFKNLVTGTLTSVQESLTPLMNAIRMVWIISRHYNRDERMVPLMARIAWEIVNRVSEVVNIKKILREPAHDCKKKIMDAKSLLETWSSAYYKVRERIEQSGRDQRWEFDRKKLFDHSNYIILRCTDLFEIAEVMEQFYSIFGPELKSVTGDPHAIDEVIKRVDALLTPFETIPFDIFEKRHLPEWDNYMNDFRDEIIQIEDMAKKFIDASFKKLRSAEGAFDLLQNIKNIKSRDAINKQLMGKWDEILEQYAREVDEINEIFLKHKDSPPYAKNQPKVAGSISWCHSLFERIKKTIVRFQSLPEMINSDQGVAVTKKYLSVAKSMRNYEDHIHHQWFSSVEGNCLSYLKCHILATDRNDLSQEVILVNFRSELQDIIKETKFLDKMGLSAPDAALNVTLQEEKYHNLCKTLTAMIKSYNSVIDPMDVAERKLFETHILELKRIMRPGFVRLNWNSLGVPDFIQKCNLEINKLSSLLTQTRKNSTSINRVIRKIASAQLICEPPSDVLVDPYEFFEMNNSHRITVLDGLLVNYNSIGPLLMKTESLVASSNSGSSKMLKDYYSFWERKIFHAVTYMITNNLSILEGFITIGTKRKICKTNRTVPLFKVAAVLSVPEILISPTPVDIHKMVFKLVRSIVDSSRLFHRWLNGTCIIAPPQKVAEDNEMYSFTFYNDLATNGNVISLINAINNALNKTFQRINDWVDAWRKYRPLWKVDKLVTLDKFSLKKPTPVQYDEKLVFYSKLANDVESQHSVRNVDFVQITANSLQNSIHREAISWVTCIGNNLNAVCLESMVQLEARLAKYEKTLYQSTDTPEELAIMLDALSNIQNSAEEVELRALDIMESYRTLKMYKLGVATEEFLRCNDLLCRWEKVRVEAKNTYVMLQKERV